MDLSTMKSKKRKKKRPEPKANKGATETKQSVRGTFLKVFG